jgi:hypothetical protein
MSLTSKRHVIPLLVPIAGCASFQTHAHREWLEFPVAIASDAHRDGGDESVMLLRIETAVQRCP